jgi:RNA polymerase sigma factor (sigma-70 family)
MTTLEDEPLVVLATECDYRPARDELIRRYLPLNERLIRRRTAHAGLQEADHDDAQQDATLWIVEAISRYRTEEHLKPGGCHFRSFLHRVLGARFTDFLRRRQRLRSHFSLFGTQADCPSCQLRFVHGRSTQDPAGGELTNPLRAEEERELRARVREELGQLGEAARQLWELMVEGVPLRMIAVELNVSYDQVKRARRKLFAHLRSSLTQSHGA